MNPTSEAERPEQRDDARRANLRRDAGSLLDNWKKLLRVHQTGLLVDFLTTRSSPEIKSAFSYEQGRLVLDEGLQAKLMTVGGELRTAYVEFCGDRVDHPPSLDDAVAGRKMVWASGDHATFLRLFQEQAGAAAAPRDLAERTEALIQAVVTLSPPPRPPRRPAPQPPTQVPTRVIPTHRPVPPLRDKGKEKEGDPARAVPAHRPHPPAAQPKRQGPQVPPKIRTKGNAHGSPLGGQLDLSRWKDPAAKTQKAVLKEVVLDPSPLVGNGGGRGPAGFDVDGVRVCAAARLDSPDVMWVNLVTGENLRAVRKDVAGTQVDYTLRYLRHGRARSGWNDIAVLSRYRLIDLTCTVSFQQSRYWIPAIERWLYATGDEPYFGLTNLQVAFAAPTVHKRSQFLKSFAVGFETNLIESASLQTVEILWTATKLLLDDSGDEVDGYLTLNTQSTALTAADARSKHYFTVKRS